MMIKNLPPRLAERGKIKIGMKGEKRKTQAGNEFQLPVKLDHFIVTTLEKDDRDNYKPDPEAVRLFGAKPTSLPIRLLFDDPHLDFASRYACYVGKTLFCSGDGVKATRQNGAGQIEVACPCERIQANFGGDKRGKPGCEPCKFNGALSCVIDGMPGVGGVWTFRTTAYNSVQNIMSALGQFKAITGGPIAGIPFNLVVRPKLVTSPTDGKTQTVYVVSIEYPGTMDELEEHGIKRLERRLKLGVQIRNLEAEVQRVLLPAPEQAVFDGETEDEVGAEFYPIDPETGEVLSPPAPASPPADPLMTDVTPPPTRVIDAAGDAAAGDAARRDRVADALSDEFAGADDHANENEAARWNKWLLEVGKRLAAAQTVEALAAVNAKVAERIADAPDDIREAFSRDYGRRLDQIRAAAGEDADRRTDA